MNTNTHTLRLARLAVVPLLVLGLAACDNPVEEDDHPEGLVVVDASGTEVARYMVDDGVAVGSIEVGIAGSFTFTVHAVSDDGEVIEIDGTELAIEAGQVRPGWTAAVSGVNRIVVSATEPGTSGLTITLFHEDHPEFVARFEMVAS